MWSSFKDCYMEFVNDLRYVYLDDSGKGPEMEDKITFLKRCPEVERPHHPKMLFEMFCLFSANGIWTYLISVLEVQVKMSLLLTYRPSFVRYGFPCCRLVKIIRFFMPKNQLFSESISWVVGVLWRNSFINKVRSFELLDFE